MDLPLAGIKVLDLTHVASGPFCTSLLGQLGAEVIKIEPPGPGEMMRAANPKLGDGPISFYFACVNVEKRYIQINLKADRGRDVFLDLARRCDVVMQNFAPGTVRKLGIDYENVRRVNEGIIYCSITGFRSGSCYEDLPSFDYIHEAMGGVMSMTGYPGEPPPLPGLPAADMSAGVYGALAIVTALRVRDATGRGQNIEVPLQDCLTSLLPARIGYTYATGKRFPTFGRYHRDFAPFGVFATGDSTIVITVGSEDLWRRVLAVFPDLERPQFKTQADRIANMDELYRALGARLKEKTTEAWLKVFRAQGVPAAPIMDTAEVVADPYVREVSTTLPVEGGDYTWQRFPVRFSAFEPRLARAPRPAGADTADVLAAFGYSEERIRALVDAGAIGVSAPRDER